MGIIEQLTPAYYRLLRIGLEKDDSSVTAIGDMEILNADGHILANHNPSTTLTPAEKQQLRAWVNRELTAFETATGLTEWVPPPPE
jgi:hypothetical protein